VPPSSSATTGPALFQSSAYDQPNRPLLQKRMYTTSLDLSNDDSKNDKDVTSNIVDDISNEQMKLHNTLSRRLYRILLRSAKQGVETANRGNSIDSCSSSKAEGNDGDTSQAWMLLQPPMDPRKYGFAKIVNARRGNEVSSSHDVIVNNSTIVGKIMSKEEANMAMEVLRFVHISLGGDAEDDLEDYYLGSNDIDSDGKEDEDVPVEDGSVGAAADRHAEGHYTQFVDEDPERGEGGDDKLLEGYGNEEVDDDIPGVDDWDSDDDDDDELDIDEAVLVNSQDIQNAIRIAFRAPLIPATICPFDEELQSTSTIIARRHSDAINACSQLLEQFSLWRNKSSISIDWERGVRVVATSSLMMKSTESGTRKNRFSYRIRVENIADVIDEMNMKQQQLTGESEDVADGCSKEDEDKSLVESRAVQLLGRTWNISERGKRHETSSNMLQRLLDEKAMASIEVDNVEKNGGGDELRGVSTVNEPRTGAVGHLPVLGPGEVFEYMSGADIATSNGAMEGHFNMASVNMQNTDSAHVGDQKVDALHWKSNDERIFEMPVGRFGLIVDEADKM